MSTPIYLVRTSNSEPLYVVPGFGQIWAFTFPKLEVPGIYDLQVSHDLGNTWTALNRIVFHDTDNPPLVRVTLGEYSPPTAYRFFPVL
jgi:hypothetical protein